LMGWQSLLVPLAALVSESTCWDFLKDHFTPIQRPKPFYVTDFAGTFRECPKYTQGISFLLFFEKV
jgi:hypothetical protein